MGKVQSILSSGTFRQRIHGPPGSTPKPPPPPPGPSPLYYNISGAGSDEWNGHYVRQEGQEGNARQGRYRGGYGGYGGYHSTTCPASKPCPLYPYDGTWRLAVPGKELFYEATEASGNAPPLLPAGWTDLDGNAPAPSLVAGPFAPP